MTAVTMTLNQALCTLPLPFAVALLQTILQLVLSASCVALIAMYLVNLLLARAIDAQLQQLVLNQGFFDVVLRFVCGDNPQLHSQLPAIRAAPPTIASGPAPIHLASWWCLPGRHVVRAGQRTGEGPCKLSRQRLPPSFAPSDHAKLA